MNMNDKTWYNYCDEMPDAGRERWHYSGDKNMMEIYMLSGNHIFNQSDYPADSQWCYHDDEKPQNCPKCRSNSRGKEKELPGAYRVRCMNHPCGLIGPWASTEAEATAIWNRIRIGNEATHHGEY